MNRDPKKHCWMPWTEKDGYFWGYAKYCKKDIVTDLIKDYWKIPDVVEIRKVTIEEGWK